MDFKQLAHIFAPVVWLHSKENFFPDSIDNYISKCSLWKNKEKIADNVSSNDIATIYSGEEYSLKIDSNHIHGNKNLEQVPIYARIEELDTEIRLVYFFFYPYNGALNIGGTPSFKGFTQKGEHEADVEKITVFVNKHSLQISKIYIGAHGSKDGLWVAPKDLDFEGNRPIVYSSWHSHAFYPKPGIYWRILGFANDYTNKGIYWSPNIQIIEDEFPIWQKYKGALGYPDHCNIFRYRGWEDEPKISTNFWCRMFGCCRN